MEISDSLEETLVLLQDVWKYAVEEHGALSVMTSGMILMLKLYAISWVLYEQVKKLPTLYFSKLNIDSC